MFGYTGREWDSDIGLQYNRARWYAPKQGRWISQDPIGFAAGDENLYRYVGNGPTNATDPSRLFQERVVPAEQVIYGHVNYWNPWNALVFSWVSPIIHFGMEHEREKQFVQTQQEIALRNA